MKTTDQSDDDDDDDDVSDKSLAIKRFFTPAEDASEETGDEDEIEVILGDAHKPGGRPVLCFECSPNIRKTREGGDESVRCHGKLGGQRVRNGMGISRRRGRANQRMGKGTAWGKGGGWGGE